eukprot:GDKI01000715.1.p1 GENE.GDKI01000715.1~~GDKI01000715.1.p1  ORF type:complete len:219 (-),score=41.28 GDKI01000715.1:37-693(-)
MLNGERKKQKKVAVYGGSFDPITVGHILAISQVLQLGACDEVWVVPCGDRKDKKLKATPQQRYTMCQLAVSSCFSPDFPVKIKDTEIQNGAALPTYELLSRYRDEHPDLDFWLIIGTDLVPTLEKWVNGPKLVQEFNFLIVARGGYATTFPDIIMPKSYEYLERYVEQSGLPMMISNVSSTAVRDRLDTTDDVLSIQGLVPLPVANYIGQTRLYMKQL